MAGRGKAGHGKAWLGKSRQGQDLTSWPAPSIWGSFKMIQQVQHHSSTWYWYVVGFLTSLLYKWGQYAYLGKKQGRSIRSCTLEWFFEPSLSNFFSWSSTIGGVWVIGSIYIDRIVQIAALTNVPVNSGIGFFLGSSFEFIIPNLFKWAASFIPGNNK